MTKKQRLSILIAVTLVISFVAYVFYSGIIFPSQFVSYTENKMLFIQQVIVSSTFTIALVMVMFFRVKVFQGMLTVLKE